jgi:uncharacterized protein DUF5670
VRHVFLLKGFAVITRMSVWLPLSNSVTKVQVRSSTVARGNFAAAQQLRAAPVRGLNIERRMTMRFGPFLALAILLAIIWVGSFIFFHVAGALIHLLLLFAVISLVVHLFSGPRTA